MNGNNDYVVIMAGGTGTRFWPISRVAFPKQFQDILGTGKSLLRMTYERFLPVIPNENIFVVVNETCREIAMKQLPELSADQILAEPVGRNTAPCIAYATIKIMKRNPDAAIFVAASDHLISNETEFHRVARLSLDRCREDEIIITIGIEPTRPDTGYGYIQFLASKKGKEYCKVKTFTEKPDLEIAKSFLSSGDFLWNSGMFIFRAGIMAEALQLYLPDTFELFHAASGKFFSSGEAKAIVGAYTKSKNISIDHGVMEKAKNVNVIPAKFGWSDLGTWVSLYENSEKDYWMNSVYGDAILYNATNNVIKMGDPDKLVIINGLENYIIVDTGDVLMVWPKSEEQEIRDVVKEVKSKKGEKFS